MDIFSSNDFNRDNYTYKCLLSKTIIISKLSMRAETRSKGIFFTKIDKNSRSFVNVCNIRPCRSFQILLRYGYNQRFVFSCSYQQKHYQSYESVFERGLEPIKRMVLLKSKGKAGITVTRLYEYSVFKSCDSAVRYLRRPESRWHLNIVTCMCNIDKVISPDKILA